MGLDQTMISYNGRNRKEVDFTFKEPKLGGDDWELADIPTRAFFA